MLLYQLASSVNELCQNFSCVHLILSECNSGCHHAADYLRHNKQYCKFILRRVFLANIARCPGQWWGRRLVERVHQRAVFSCFLWREFLEVSGSSPLLGQLESLDGACVLRCISTMHSGREGGIASNVRDSAVSRTWINLTEVFIVGNMGYF